MDQYLEQFIREAREVSKKAYVPYSKFQVGCVVVSESGKRYSGCNVENLSFGLTVCAERAAVFKGVSVEGSSFKIARVIIFTPTPGPITPCGACRQVLYEFGEDFDIICTCNSGEAIKMNIQELLPSAPDIEIK
ncbi:MAG: cytidine deaminase [Cytophagales bacterium]|nr:cytidine deaminase [Cytophagales bacterium]